MRIVSARGAITHCLSALTLWSASASAQEKAADTLVQSFSRCRAVAGTDARLDCFDKATQALEKAVASRDIAIADRQQVRTAQRSLFGLNIGRLPLFGGGDHDGVSSKRESFTRLDTTVVSTQPLPGGNVQLKVAEGGAVWVTTDPMPFPPRPGTKVSIERGALGNYFINAEGQRSVRGTRLR